MLRGWKNRDHQKEGKRKKVGRRRWLERRPRFGKDRGEKEEVKVIAKRGSRGKWATLGLIE